MADRIAPACGAPARCPPGRTPPLDVPGWVPAKGWFKLVGQGVPPQNMLSLPKPLSNRLCKRKWIFQVPAETCPQNLQLHRLWLTRVDRRYLRRSTCFKSIFRTFEADPINQSTLSTSSNFAHLAAFLLSRSWRTRTRQSWRRCGLWAAMGRARRRPAFHWPAFHGVHAQGAQVRSQDRKAESWIDPSA